MGSKSPDQINASAWRSSAETAADMARKGWELVARCRACDLILIVDLRVVIATRGPGFSLWNRHTRCRRIVFAGRCRGFVDFEFRAPGMTTAKPLAAPDRLPDHRMGHVERAFHEQRQRLPTAQRNRPPPGKARA